MTRREGRGKWLFLSLTAFIASIPEIGAAIVVLGADWDHMQSPFWWLGVGLGVVFPFVTAYLWTRRTTLNSWRSQGAGYGLMALCLTLRYFFRRGGSKVSASRT